MVTGHTFILDESWTSLRWLKNYTWYHFVLGIGLKVPIGKEGRIIIFHSGSKDWMTVKDLQKCIQRIQKLE